LNDKFKAELIYLTPIIVSLLFGAACTSLLLASSLEIYPVTPLPGNIFGSLGNALYFVVLAGVGASLIYFLLKRRRHRLITIITGFALTAATFLLSSIYVYVALSKLSISHTETLTLIFSAALTVLVYITIFRTQNKACDITVLCLGGALGAFLGASIPTLSAIFILCFLAVYDTFAVYRGPVGKIARSGLEHLRGLSFSFKDVQMGLGDLTFYSMLSGHMLINFNPISCFATIIGILIGCLLGFKMLEKKGVFPGLPLPILFGLAAGFLASLM